MRIGLTAKLILLLVLVALLPLVAALLTIVVGGGRLRTESTGQSFVAVAEYEGQLLRQSLLKDVEKLDLLLHEPPVLDNLAAAQTTMSETQRSQIDRSWPDLPADDPQIRQITQNPLAQTLSLVPAEDGRFAELLLTDRSGNLVAATGKTSDFHQADEDWWKQAHNGGRGRWVVTDVYLDESAGRQSVSLCLPVKRDGQILGILKAVLDVQTLVGSRIRYVGELAADMTLVNDEGYALSGARANGPDSRLGQWEGELSEMRRSGWRIDQDGQLQAYAPIRAPSRVGTHPLSFPAWSVVLSMPASEAMARVYRLSATLFAIGLVIILAVFLLGVFLVDRSVLRRIRRLAEAARRLGTGEMDYRLGPRWAGRRLLGSDQLDGLAASFNSMADRVQQTHRELTDANELKGRFIRVAGHELRTPVSYLLAMARLVEATDDPDRLAQAVRGMAVKSRRLDQIIQDLFKLVSGEQADKALHLEEFTVGQLVDDVLAEVSPFADSRSQSIQIDAEPPGPTLHADRAMLADVLVNLLMNAVKFTPDGGTIRLTCREVLADRLRVEVADQGPGISQADLPNIFQPFYTGGEVLQHSTGKSEFGKKGMGLGLAVVKYFVQLHGGDVEVKTSDAGSIFAVEIPLQADPPESDSPEA